MKYAFNEVCASSSSTSSPRYSPKRTVAFLAPFKSNAQGRIYFEVQIRRVLDLDIHNPWYCRFRCSYRTNLVCTHIQANLQQVLLHNLILHATQLLHVPSTRNISACKPIAPLGSKPYEGVCCECGLIDQDVVCRLGHALCELGRDSTRVHSDAQKSLLAVLRVNEFGEADKSKFATLVCGSSRHEDVSSDRGDVQDGLQSVVLLEEKGDGRANN